jgi:hypothetical protein
MGGGGQTSTMTIESLNFSSGHGQNDHFSNDHNTILSSNGHVQMVEINRYFNNVNKKSGMVEIFMIKFGLTILTIELLIWPNGQ